MSFDADPCTLEGEMECVRWRHLHCDWKCHPMHVGNAILSGQWKESSGIQRHSLWIPQMCVLLLNLEKRKKNIKFFIFTTVSQGTPHPRLSMALESCCVVKKPKLGPPQLDTQMCLKWHTLFKSICRCCGLMPRDLVLKIQCTNIRNENENKVAYEGTRSGLASYLFLWSIEWIMDNGVVLLICEIMILTWEFLTQLQWLIHIILCHYKCLSFVNCDLIVCLQP